MTHFWSIWVMSLICFNLAIVLGLFLWAPRAKIPMAADGTTGHEWADGTLREGLGKPPIWWIVVSVGLFAAAVVYLTLYPGFGDSNGLLGWTSKQEVAQRTSANNVLNAALDVDHSTLVQLAANLQAQQAGHRLFNDNCAGCHGREALGNPLIGIPNLADNDWLYGGDERNILNSIVNGRRGIMPVLDFGDSGITNLANYVLSLSGAGHDAPAAERGKPLFAVACVACHGNDGQGNQTMGGPNLTDDIWLYGGDLATIENTIRNGHVAVMPAWGQLMSPADTRLVAAWVYGLSHQSTRTAAAL